MFRSITTIVATLAVSGFVHAQDAVQWKIEDGGNGHWYSIENSQPLSWDDASNQAAAIGAVLVCLESAEEQSWVFEFAEQQSFWLGLYQDPDTGEPNEDWQWLSGAPLSYENWDTGEPNESAGAVEDRAQVLETIGTWNDLIGDVTQAQSAGIATIIEWSEDCNDDGIVDYGQILDGSLTDDNGNGIPDCCEEDNCFTSAVQWELENGGNGHWYMGISDPGISWDDAAAQAASVGGHLCTVPTEVENVWVFDNVASDPSLWNGWYGPFIGGYQDLDADDYSEPAGGWRWVTGEEWNYTAWTPGDPSNTGPQDHLAYGGTSGNPIQPRWNDLEAPEPGGYVIEWSDDCNDDGIVDYGQILDGTLEDLDENGIPDCCDQGYACFPPDCNGNGIDDAIDLGNGTSPDCNANGIPDECDLASGDSEDCNANGTPDECESLGDCDLDGISDVCEILNGAVDANPADGIPDECQGLPVGACCIGGKCVLTSLAQCFEAGGTFAGEAITCAQANCPQQCDGDANGDSVVNITDLLILLSAFGNPCP